MKTKTVSETVHAAIAVPFYRQHSGAFLFLFFLLFGIQPSFPDAMRLHYGIINGILHSTGFLLLATVAWVLYAVRVTAFIRNCLLNPAFDFLFQLNVLEPNRSLRILFAVTLTLLAPITAYAVAIVIIGLIIGEPLRAGCVTLIIAALHLLVALAIQSMLTKGEGMRQVIRRRRLLRLRPGLFVFLMQYIFRRQFLALFLTKLISFTCLFFFVRTSASVFEERMLWMLYITFLVGHSLLIYKNFQFMENELGFYRNLPVSVGRTLLSLLAVYVVLLLPECWALRGLAVQKQQFADYGWMVLTGPAMLLLLHAILYSEDLDMEEFLKLLFGCWIVLVFASLSRSRWIIPLALCIAATTVFFVCYYRYEKNAEIGKLK